MKTNSILKARIEEDDGSVRETEHRFELEVPEAIDLQDDVWEAFAREFPDKDLDVLAFESKLRMRRLGSLFGMNARALSDAMGVPRPEEKASHHFTGNEFDIILWLAHRQLLVMQGARRSADKRRRPASHLAFLQFLATVPPERRKNLHGLRFHPGYGTHQKSIPRVETRRALLKGFNEQHSKPTRGD